MRTLEDIRFGPGTFQIIEPDGSESGTEMSHVGNLEWAAETELLANHPRVVPGPRRSGLLNAYKTKLIFTVLA